jgi:nitrite reductase (NADH) small subunit
MSDGRWIRVTEVGNIPPREGRAVIVGGRELALFNLSPSTALGASTFLATDPHCPHEGGPLCDGIVTGSSVVCPLHAWKIDLESGQVTRPSHGREHCVATYETKVEDGVVSVRLPGARAHVEAA